MSDQPTVPTTEAAPTPNTEAGQPVAQPAAEATPAAQPFAVFADAKAFNTRVGREARKLMNDQAKTAGFDDWQHMQDTLGTLRQTPTTEAAPTPEAAATPAAPATPAQPSEAARLRMALKVASDLSLPPTLVDRLQGDTPEEMTADANRLLALFQQPARGPGIPPAPNQSQPATFTRAQLQNPQFVREHQAEIVQAMREGRIVDS